MIEKILKTRNLDSCPLPLWTLKVTDDEYRELKSYIKTCLEKYLVDLSGARNRDESNNCKLRACRLIGEDAVLFYGEYWRREYAGNDHSDDDVFRALGVEDDAKGDARRMFEDAAKYGVELKSGASIVAQSSGWKRLGMRLNRDIYVAANNSRQMLDSFLYQGGMPMNYIAMSSGNNWDSFIEQLLRERIDFEELRMGTIAAQVEGPISFCRELKSAFDRTLPDYRKGWVKEEHLRLMPFFADEVSNRWFRYVMQKGLEETKKLERKSSSPFSIVWNMTFGMSGEIELNYEIRSANQLSDEFLKEHGLEESDVAFFRCIYENAQEQLSGDLGEGIYFTKNTQGELCQNSYVPITSKYFVGDLISIVCESTGETLLQRSFNLELPFLTAQTSGNSSVVCSSRRLNFERSAYYYLFVPEGWTLANEGIALSGKVNCDGKDFEYYTIDGSVGAKDIVVSRQNDGQKMVFSTNSEQEGLVVVDKRFEAFAEIRSVNHETLYDEKSSKFKLVHGDNRERELDRNCLSFSSYMSNANWTDRMPSGRILAKYESNSSEIVSERLINISGLEYSFPIKNADSCCMKISLEDRLYGIEVENSRQSPDGSWMVNKNDLADKRYIRVDFKHPDSFRSFALLFRAPFVEAAIYDNCGNRIIGRDKVLPFSALSMYNYRIFGDISFTIRVGRRGDKGWETVNEYRNVVNSSAENRVVSTTSITGTGGPSGSIAREGLMQMLFRYMDIDRPTSGYEVLRNYVDCNGGMADVALFKPGAVVPFLSFRVLDEPYVLRRFDNRLEIGYYSPFEKDEMTGNNLFVRLDDYKGKIYYVKTNAVEHIGGGFTFEDDGYAYIPDNLIDEGAKVIFFGDRYEGIVPRFEDLAAVRTNAEARVSNLSNLEKVERNIRSSKLFGEGWEKTMQWYRLALTYGIKPKYLFATSIVAQDKMLLVKLIYHLLLENHSQEQLMDMSRNLFLSFNLSIFGLAKEAEELVASIRAAVRKERLIATDSVYFLSCYTDWMDEHDEAGEDSFIGQTLDNLLEYVKNIGKYIVE